MAATPQPVRVADRVERWLEREAAIRRPVDERVAELLAAIRGGAQRAAGESWDTANERHADAFIEELTAEFGPRVLHAPAGAPPFAPFEGWKSDGLPKVTVLRQTLSLMARRTTRFNYIFTVPGERREQLILIAHYDTWRGPGADDNTTGEEIIKQYLRDDLRASTRPELTHTYILAGSEECGLIGFTSQVLLALGLSLANAAMTRGVYAVTALGLLMVPLARFRFGVSGSREYVRSLSSEELATIQSVVSVDSVGEGRMYIPESSLGANFVRAFVPFDGYDQLNDLLKEAAHLHGIKYNTFIAGGTTDHVSFLEVNNSLRDRLADWLGAPWLANGNHSKRKIPAAALVALCRGKASPLVFGGKIHTPADTPDRVYPQPLAEALRMLDYWFHLMHGGARVAQPRDPQQCHYAQLFRVQLASGGEEYWLALKDALEPNRRNLNSIYRVGCDFSGDHVRCSDVEQITWGVETNLAQEVADCLRETGGGGARRLDVSEIELSTATGTLRFARRPHAWRYLPSRAFHWALGQLERAIGSNTFLAFFLTAYVLAKSVDVLMGFAFSHSVVFQQWFFDWFVLTLPLTVGAEIAVLLWLISVRLPTMIDNNYRNLNKADNLASLRRVPNN